MYYCKECGIPLHDDNDREFPQQGLYHCIVCKKEFNLIDGIDTEGTEGVLYVQLHTLNKAVEQLLEAAIPTVMEELKTMRELNVTQQRKLESIGYGHFSMQEHRLKEAEELRDVWRKRVQESTETIDALRVENQRLVNEVNNLLLKAVENGQ